MDFDAEQQRIFPTRDEYCALDMPDYFGSLPIAALPSLRSKVAGTLAVAAAIEAHKGYGNTADLFDSRRTRHILEQTRSDIDHIMQSEGLEGPPTQI